MKRHNQFNNKMLMHAFILVCVLATAKSAEAEVTMEAAFQGHCGHTSPCEQLCYEIHDGMYECDCIEGYELNKNGYSCQVINSTSSGDAHSKSDEDVLYQKGASFSAKLDNNNNNDEREDDTSLYYASQLSSLSAAAAAAAASSSSASASSEDNDDSAANAVENFYAASASDGEDDLERPTQQQDLNANDYYISAESISFSDELQDANQRANSGPDVPEYPAASPVNAQHGAAAAPQRRATLTTLQPIKVGGRHAATTTAGKAAQQRAIGLAEAMLNDNIEEEDYYSKQEDMSVYDDVNNNQLNLRPLSHTHNTYQPRQQLPKPHPPQSNSNSHIKLSTNQEPETQSQQRVQQDTVAQQHYVSISVRHSLNHNEVGAATTSTATASASSYTASAGAAGGKILENTANISNSSASDVEAACKLDCGPEGVCDNSERVTSGQRCLCPFGKTGGSCISDIKVRVPKFSNRSWLAFPALRGAYKHVQIRVEFRPESFDGIILLSGERDDLTGDFMALLLNKGFVEFWFDCGSGVGSVRSRETILLNEWNSVIIYRHRWDAWLVLNQGTKVQGRSNGLFSRITFREPVFLGGTGNITGLAKRLPVYSGFVGCIRRFVANEHQYKFEEHPLGDVTKGFDIQDCVTDKCFKYPCQHGGKCLPSDQGAVCLCPIGFVGDLCEIRMDLQVPAFNGSSFLRYAPLGDSALIWLELKVILKPEHPDGLILYSGPERHGDFIALSLNDGFVEFTFDLGSGPAVVRSEYPITIGQWHVVQISRTARLAVLKIDQAPEVMTISSNGFWHLSLPEHLFLGGVNHVDKLPLDLKFKPFFVGCIQKIDINGHSLGTISEALGGTNIGNCPHACVARPCGPLAECVPQMESYECRCSALNAQCNKAAEVPLAELQQHRANGQAKDKPQSSSSRTNEPKHFSKHTLKAKKQLPTHKRAKVHGKLPHRMPQSTSTSTTTTTPGTTTLTSDMQAAQWTAEQLHQFEAEPADESGDIDDDIIFRDVQEMRRKNEQLERVQQKEYSKKPPSRKLQQHPHGTKHDPYQRLSRLPTHYESFQTNPDSDILTFDESVEVQVKPRHQAASAERAAVASSAAAEPFVIDESLFDESDGTEEYQRKQLAQDMRRIMANAPGRSSADTHTTQRPEAPKLVLSEYVEEEHAETDDYPQDQAVAETDDLYSVEFGNVVDGDGSNNNIDNDRDDNLLEPVQDSGSDSAQAAPPKLTTHTTTPQTHTDWSLLKKLELSADQQTQLIGVRKNFGACFVGKDSYFHYNDAETMSQIISYNIDLNLRIKTHSSNGVILWTGRQGDTADDGDFLSLGIENGYLHFRYDLGSGELDIKFNLTKVSDGLWHRVRALRDSQEGYLEVDGRKTGTLHSPGKLRQLNTDTGLYVGGVPELSYFTRRKYTRGIVGCISEIVLAGELKLNFDPNTLGTAHNVETGIL